MPVPRTVRAAVVLALLPLAACSVQGDIVVGDDALSLDLTISHATSGDGVGDSPCSSMNGEWVMTPLPSPPGTIACSLEGEVPLVAATGAGLLLQGRDHLFLRWPPSALSREDDPLEAVDVSVHFPGAVVAASDGAWVYGSTVRWTDADRVRTEGVSATASRYSPIPRWALPAGLGVVWGAAAVGGLTWLRRRPVALRNAGDAVGEASAGTVAAPESPESPAEPEDPRVWAPDA